jgi:mono/diheme cytochrome c family protein
MRILALAGWGLLFLAGTLCAVELPPAADRKVSFAEDIQPLLARHCYACHGPDKQESNFRLDNAKIALAGGDLGERAILPRKSADSPLVKYIAGVDPNIIMPPKGAKLSAKEVGLIRAWIDQGAEFPAAAEESLKLTTKHWSFQPLDRSKWKKDATFEQRKATLDAFILEKLRAAKLEPSAKADRTTLIRRIYFDMLGLPPSPEEIAAFVKDPDPQAYHKLIERVLASPRYGERWARHWLDVVRFAETNGFETNVERPNAYHYRDYVIDALNSDVPYDRFIIEQLAGDAVGADAATGFLVGGPWDQVKSPDPTLTAMQRSDELADITNTTATTFLGLTVGCARCHNHKFDPILQKDYYALQAVFAGVQHGDRAMQKPQTPEVKQKAAAVQERLAEVRSEIDGLQRPSSQRGRMVMLDDETLDGASKVELLAAKAGHGLNPDGTARGQKNDPGDFDRFPNVSRGRYTWFANKSGEDFIVYRPALRGSYRVWLSWGCGFETHTKDAVYLLDADGDLKTKDDQRVIATIDQQQFAHTNPKRERGSDTNPKRERGSDTNPKRERGSDTNPKRERGSTPEPLPSAPLWSGFASAGIHKLEPSSVILLRGGKTGTALTADTIALEEVPENLAGKDEPSQPPLRPAVNSKENVERFPPVAARFIRFTTQATNNGSEPCIDELEVYSVATENQPSRNVALAAAKLTSGGDYQGNPIHRLEHLNDGKYGNSFSWISNTAGRGWVQIELAETAMIDRIAWARDRSEQYRDRTPTSYAIEVATEPGQWREVASSSDRLPADVQAAPQLAYFGLSEKDAAQAKALFAEQKQIEQQLQSLTTSQMAYAGVFNQPGPTHRLFRGDPMQPREAVTPDCLTVLGTLGLSADAKEQQRRLALAKWIASPENPLTARVMVNRVWQHHFGTGIVDTPSDFGVNGTRPTHPELLDWLTVSFLEEGWSLKKLHRLILSSDTYQQANTPHAAGLKADAQCRLLWRYPPHRLEAEALRDTILATSGKLDLRMGGPGWTTFKPNSNYVRFYDPKEEFGPDEFRRAIYMFKVRMRQDGVFGAFDCPDAGQIAPKRARSTTALQALNLFNSQFIVDQSKFFAERVARDAGGKPDVQVALAFQLAFGRAPDAEEAKSAAALVSEHGLPALCRALFNANEFLFIP